MNTKGEEGVARERLRVGNEAEVRGPLCHLDHIFASR